MGVTGKHDISMLIKDEGVFDKIQAFSASVQAIAAIITGFIVYYAFEQQKLINLFQLNHKGFSAHIIELHQILRTFLDFPPRPDADDSLHHESRRLSRNFRLMYSKGMIEGMDDGECNPTYALYSRGLEFAVAEYQENYDSCQSAASVFGKKYLPLIDLVRALEVLPKPSEFREALQNIIDRSSRDDDLIKRYIHEDEAAEEEVDDTLRASLRYGTVTLAGKAFDGTHFAYVALRDPEEYIKITERITEAYHDDFNFYPEGGDELVLSIRDDVVRMALPVSALHPKYR